jgi:thioredoxin 1
MNTIYIGAGILVAVFIGMIVYLHFKNKNKPVYKKSEKIKLLNAKSFKVGAGSGLVLVDFWAPSYLPCKELVPVLNEVAENDSVNLSVARLNVEQYKQVALRYKIKSLPTLILFKDGVEVNRIVGVQTKKAILKQVAQYA